jgi:hypothetical protein
MRDESLRDQIAVYDAVVYFTVSSLVVLGALVCLFGVSRWLVGFGLMSVGGSAFVGGVREAYRNEKRRTWWLRR